MPTTSLTELYRIDQFNDTFALGHYARVVDALYRRTGQTVALKVLRPEHLLPTLDGDIRWEVIAFGNEADLLMRLVDSPYMVKLVDCGFVSDHEEAPNGGEIISMGLDTLGYRQQLRQQVQRGWRPYLALENVPRIHNLLYLMKPNTLTNRRRLPSEEGLALTVQFAEFLKFAHRQNIVYLDHKLDHVYWDGARLRIIDLNSSKLLEPNAPDTPQQIIKDIHNLCVGILYPIFTGMSPVKTTLRPQPGDQNTVDTRYSEVNTLDFGIEPSLSESLIQLLQQGASMQIPNIDTFIRALQAVAAQHGWDFSDYYTSPASRTARDDMRVGLRKLREGEDRLREARDLFREAAIQEGITPDLESELRRLVKAINDALNYRVIP